MRVSVYVVYYGLAFGIWYKYLSHKSVYIKVFHHLPAKNG